MTTQKTQIEEQAKLERKNNMFCKVCGKCKECDSCCCYVKQQNELAVFQKLRDVMHQYDWVKTYAFVVDEIERLKKLEARIKKLQGDVNENG